MHVWFISQLFSGKSITSALPIATSLKWSLLNLNGLMLCYWNSQSYFSEVSARAPTRMNVQYVLKAILLSVNSWNSGWLFLDCCSANSVLGMKHLSYIIQHFYWSITLKICLIRLKPMQATDSAAFKQQREMFTFMFTRKCQCFCHSL